MLLWAMALSTCMTVCSSLALKGSKWIVGKDRNFRCAVLLKGALLAAKSMLLTFPEPAGNVDVRYMWSCVESYCPSSCLSMSGGGRCVVVHDQCTCQSLRPQVIVLILTIATTISMSILTLVDVSKIVCRGRRAIELSSMQMVG